MPPTAPLPPADTVTAIILAGGGGERVGGLPKAFLRHGGLTLLEHALALLAPFAGRVVACLPADRLGDAPAGLVAVAGGASRQRSLAAGLAQTTTPHVLLHEVARPFATPALVRAALAALAQGADAAVPVVALPVRDSLVAVSNGRIRTVLAREELHHSQTPQAYRRSALADAVTAALAQGREETTAFAPMLRDGLRVDAVAGEAANVKITYAADLALLDGAT